MSRCTWAWWWHLGVSGVGLGLGLGPGADARRVAAVGDANFGPRCSFNFRGATLHLAQAVGPSSEYKSSKILFRSSFPRLVPGVSVQFGFVLVTPMCLRLSRPLRFVQLSRASLSRSHVLNYGTCTGSNTEHISNVCAGLILGAVIGKYHTSLSQDLRYQSYLMCFSTHD